MLEKITTSPCLIISTFPIEENIPYIEEYWKSNQSFQKATCLRLRLSVISNTDFILFQDKKVMSKNHHLYIQHGMWSIPLNFCVKHLGKCLLPNFKEKVSNWCNSISSGNIIIVQHKSYGYQMQIHINTFLNKQSTFSLDPTVLIYNQGNITWYVVKTLHATFFDLFNIALKIFFHHFKVLIYS